MEKFRNEGWNVNVIRYKWKTLLKINTKKEHKGEKEEKLFKSYRNEESNKKKKRPEKKWQLRQRKSNKQNPVGIPGNKSKWTEQILKTNSRKHSENNRFGRERHIIEKTDLEGSIPRHILAKFLDSKEKKKKATIKERNQVTYTETLSSNSKKMNYVFQIHKIGKEKYQ